MYFDVVAVEYIVEEVESVVQPSDGDGVLASGINIEPQPKLTTADVVAGCGNNKHSCNHCGRSFALESSLKKHVVMSHDRRSQLELHGAVDVLKKPARAGVKRRAATAAVPLYQCTQCEEKFSTLNELETHMEVHVCMKPYKCSLCSEAFSLPIELQVHVESHASTTIHVKRTKRYSVHKRSVENGAVESSNELPGEKPYKCYLCSASFKRSCDLNAHVKGGHRSDKPHRCAVCGKNFRLPRELEFHMLYHGEKPYRCQFCEKYETYDFSNLRSHVQRHHWRIDLPDGVNKCSACRLTFDQPSELELHLLRHGDKPYCCPHCDHTSNDFQCFKKHVRHHAPVLPFQCCECERRFIDRHEWRKHMSKHPDATTPHPCTVCERTFVNAVLLADHTKRFHDPSRFQCPHCDKSFSDKTYLKSHVDDHLAPRLPERSDSTSVHPCPHCSRTFSSQRGLQRHVMFHYDDSRHWCSDCGRSFKSFEEIKKHHEKNHIKFPEQLGGVAGIIPAKQLTKVAVSTKRDVACPKCSAMFCTHSALKYHMKIHDPKLYGCNQCGLSFHDMDRLQKHVQKYVPCGWCKCIECGDEFETCEELHEHLMSSHSRTIKCDECDECFFTMRQLLVHLKTHVPIRVIISGQTS